eukprot:scaffold144969_cov28-Tisochrysis_lutea.AAC.1
MYGAQSEHSTGTLSRSTFNSASVRLLIAIRVNRTKIAHTTAKEAHRETYGAIQWLLTKRTSNDHSIFAKLRAMDKEV